MLPNLNKVDNFSALTQCVKKIHVFLPLGKRSVYALLVMFFQLVLFIVQQARYVNSELKQEREELDIALAQVTGFDENHSSGILQN